MGRSKKNDKRAGAIIRAGAAAGAIVAVEALEARTLLDANLVKDINPSTSTYGTPSRMTDVNGVTYFTSYFKLWKTNGTGGGTVQVSNSAWDPQQLTVMSGNLYFVSGGTLWKSDGTEPGTVQVSPTWINPRYLTAVGSRLYFRGADGGGDELWTSDGTQTGTVRLKDINPGATGSDPRGLTNVGGKLIFHATDGASGDELWTSDGTAGGTARVKDINPGSAGSFATEIKAIGGVAYFTANDGAHGYELWRSDGTSGGTAMVKDIRSGAGGSTPVMLQNVNGKLMFLANDGASGFEIWQSDGTTGGTSIVKDIIPGSASPNISNLASAGGTLYFTAEDNTGFELWKTDGTAAGTMQVKDIVAGPQSSHPDSLMAVGNRLYFIANNNVNGRELWSSDGTATGTALLKDIYPGGGWSSITSMSDIGGQLYFAADDSVSQALWKSDGTTAGTELVKRCPGFAIAGGGINNGIDVNGVAFFAANDGVHGQELWKTDGTEAGTMMVKDINPGIGGTGLQKLTNVGGTLFFSANDRLWKSDGTAAGTIALNSAVVTSPTHLTAVGSICYFVGYSGTQGGWSLWKSDGTSAGTVQVKDVNALSPLTLPESLCNVNGTLMFVADDGVHGFELWKSDGTPAGTVMVSDIVAGAASSGARLLTDVNGTVFFRATDGASGWELWKSDGTAAGTVMVKDIRAGAGSSVIQTLVNFNGTLIFQADDGVHGQELWKSDGTTAGTVILRDVYPGTRGSSPGQLTVVGNVMYFRGDDGPHGNELWKTDGTEAGTVMVEDIYSGLSGSSVAPIRAHAAAGLISFVANNGTNGYQTWRSDGTAGGTYPVFEQIAWDGFASGNNLFFRQWTGPVGDELRKVDVTTAAPLSASLVGPKTLAPLTDISPSAQFGGSSAAGDDVFYRTLEQPGIPDFASAGLPHMHFSYTEHWASNFDLDIIDETTVRKLAQKYADLNIPVIFDIEHWSVDVRWSSLGEVQWGLEKMSQLVDWMHDERPDVRVAPGGLFPTGNYPTPAPGTPAYEQWQAANDVLRPLVEKIDFVSPAVPVAHPKFNEYMGYARGIVTEAARYNKPLYTILWPRHDFGDGNVAQRFLPPAYWRAMLDVASELGDGAIFWLDGEWKDDMPWYTISRDFAQAQDPLLPATATALSAVPSNNSARIDLSWQDNAYNESGYRIERRALGENDFSAVATVAAGASTFADTAAEPEVQYTYRVIAINSAGEAPASNESAASIKALRGRWRLDESSGTTAFDATNSGRNGTVAGAAWAGGNLGGALLFDGLDDRVVIADAADLRVAAGQDLSVSAWVNLTTLPNKRSAIIAKSRASGAWYSVGIDATNHWIISGPAGDIVGPVATPGWTHLTFVQDGTAGTRKLYVNGVQVTSGAAQAGNGTGALWFGGAEGTSEFFPGKIDEVRVYRRALPASYVSSLANDFVILAGDGGDDAWTVRLSVDGANYEFFDGIVTGAAAPAFTRPRDTVAAINVIGAGGNDQLLVDYIHGAPFLEYGFNFDGGAGSDTLLLRTRYPFSETDVNTHNIWHNGPLSFDDTESLSLAVGAYYIAGDMDGIALNVNSGATAYFDTMQHLSNLQITGGSHVNVGQSGTSTIVTGGLSIDTASQLDLADNDLLVTYNGASPIGSWNGSAYTGVTGLIQSGQIITSMSYADFTTRVMGVGEASFVLGLSGSETALWNDEVVDATTVIVKYTYAGDIDLNGHLDGDDYFYLDSYVLQSGSTFGYSFGDLNLDGELNGDDYWWIDSQILSQGPPL